MRLRYIALLMLVTVLPFGAAFIGIALAVNYSNNVEQLVRTTQNKRATVLRLQLDEETAMRGYVDTQNVIYLAPYHKAEQSFDPALRGLRTVVSELAPGVVPAVDEEQTVHQRWQRSVADPLIAHPRGQGASALQLQGKALIDRFRDDNDTVLTALDSTAQQSDTFARRVVYAIIAIGFALGIGLLAVLAWIADRQRRLAEQLRLRTALHDRESQIADALQDALMPYDVPSIPGLALHARYGPADRPERVGGDWYDAIPMPDGRILIIIGDVTGHGITAIELMSRLRRKIMAAALHKHDPGAILTEANRQILATFPDEPPLGTAICAFIDPATREIAFANAGHPPPILIESGIEARLLRSSDLLLGVQEHAYKTHVAHAIGKAILVFYTDGLTEFARDPLGGEAKLVQATRDVALSEIEDPARAIQQRVLGDARPHDDVAILTVTFGFGGIQAVPRTATGTETQASGSAQSGRVTPSASDPQVIRPTKQVQPLPDADAA